MRLVDDDMSDRESPSRRGQGKNFARKVWTYVIECWPDR